MSKSLTTFLNNPQELQNSLKPFLQHLPDATNLVLVVANMHILALITWLVVSDPPDSAVSALPVTTTSSQPDNKQAFRELTSAHLFGVMGTKTAPSARAPETRLNLILKGILADNPMKNATVIISQGMNGKEDVYGLGDKIPGGVTIKSIHAEHIILDRQGQLETLRLLKENEIKSLPLPELPDTPETTPGDASLKDIRDSIVKNPAEFTKYAIPVPAKEDGKQVGYRLQARNGSQLLAEIGIQPNDIITSINGIKLDNPNNSMNAIRKLSTATTASITIKRDNAEIPLSIQLQ